MKNLVVAFFICAINTSSFASTDHISKCNSLLEQIYASIKSDSNRNPLKDSSAMVYRFSQKNQKDIKSTSNNLYFKFKRIYELLAENEKFEKKYYENELSQEASDFFHKIK